MLTIGFSSSSIVTRGCPWAMYCTAVKLMLVIYRCSQWYHCDCVGIHPGDPRLESADIYTCPPCANGYVGSYHYLVANDVLPSCDCVDVSVGFVG